MSAKQDVLQPVSGGDAVSLFFYCLLIGAWQFLKISFRRLWKGHKRKSTKSSPPSHLIDSSIGTHCYIKVMGAKYHYVETGPSSGEVVLLLGDAPGVGAASGAGWASVAGRLADSGRRVVALDLRGTGGSESGSRQQLSPPYVVEELHNLLLAFGVSKRNPAIVVGHGIGGLLTWYLVHSHGELISKFVVIGAPHPNLYWQYPPATFCRDVLCFIQWPWLPERWLAESETGVGDGSAAAESLRWACSRACDWSGALHYVRGAAWWRIASGARASPPALLVGPKDGATQVVGSAEYCSMPTLRLVARIHPSFMGCSSDLRPLVLDYLLGDDKPTAVVEDTAPSGIMGRVLGAVAGRGRELSAAVSRARLVLPLAQTSPPTPA